MLGTHGTQLHGKQLSSYKLRVWLFFLAIINSVMQVGSAQVKIIGRIW